MRMVKWLGGAAAVVLAGGVYLGIQSKESAPGRLIAWCFSSQSDSHTCSKCGCSQPEEIPTLDELPSEPIAIEEPQLLASVESTGPAPIVIREDEPAEIASVPETIDLAIFKGPMAPADAAVGTLTMPYCAEDAPPPMPYVSDGDEADAGELSWAKPYEVEHAKGCTYKQPRTEDSEAPRCEVVPAHYQHYSGTPPLGSCPYACPHHHSDYKPMPLGVGQEPTEALKDLQPVGSTIQRHESFKPNEKGKLPRQAVVDTMEYRKSDGKLNDFGPGPF